MDRTPIRITLLAVLALLLAGVTSASAQTGPIAALGDSNPAGSGLLPPAPGAPAGCFRSVNGHPRIAATALGAARYADATCQSAKTDHMWAWQDILGDPLANAPQLATLVGDEAIVTLTIGDNDSDLTGVAEHCMPAAEPPAKTCHEYFQEHDLDAQVDAVEQPLHDALAAIRQRSPHAQIFIVGYQRLLPQNVASCSGRINVTADDAKMVTGWQRRMNNLQRDVAADSGAVFVDLFSQWAPGRDGCADQSTAWVKPNLGGPPAWPLHPTLLGQQAAASHLINAVVAAGLWTPDPEAPQESAGPPLPTPIIDPVAADVKLTPAFKRMRVARGGHAVMRLTRPRRGGGRFRVSTAVTQTVHVRLERLRSGRVVGGRCQTAAKQVRGRSCKTFRAWGATTRVRLTRGTKTSWLTGSSARRPAPAGIYRLRVAGSGPSTTSARFHILKR